MDHRVLHRLDVRSRGGVDMFREQLNGQQTPLVSYEDHTPGQGQYRDRTVMERRLQDAQHMDQRRAAEHVDQLIASRDEELPFREETLAWLGGLAAAKSIRRMGHDAVTPAEIDELVARNASIAEFPTTIEAALHAKQLGIDTVAGAPNVLLGGSHSGNVSALDLAHAGCLNILASDYLPSSLLAAAFEIARLGHASLPATIGMICSNPAAVGLDDRGVLEAGRRADLSSAPTRTPGRGWSGPSQPWRTPKTTTAGAPRKRAATAPPTFSRQRTGDSAAAHARWYTN
jgi:alpha-D-ribose 1-methylphosphonate 5-triphosphate diphosphatase